jgi:tetratricopeptide (TPR) repeat protein
LGLALGVLPLAGASLEPPEIEEGAAFARGVAAAAIEGNAASFAAALDTDRMVAARLGEKTWQALTERQRDELRAYVRDRFLLALAPPRGATGSIAWSSARAREDGSLAVDTGLALDDRVLKTRWTVVRRAGAWKVADVTLSDPGISLSREAVRAVGVAPVRRSDRAREARAELLPRALGIAAILLVVFFARRRLSPQRRTLLYLTAAAPAVLFAVDGLLAARRAYSETYALARRLPEQPWKGAEEAAERAVRQRDLPRAQAEWSRALALGAPRGPALYRMAQVARERGFPEEARGLFEQALAQSDPAPGAARELAAYALADKRDREARTLLERYIAGAGPDPETLWLLAVAESNLGNHPAGLEAMRAARAMLGDTPDGAELEARVRARAADARGTVEALRRVEPGRRLDRSALRADPTYLSIATDPAWIAFLAETPVPVTPEAGSR